MAFTYSTAAKTARMEAVNTLLDGGKLEIGTAAMAVLLAEFALTSPAGVVVADVLTLDFDPDISDTGLADGTAAAAQFKDSSNNVVISGLTVGLSGSGADIILTNTSIATGQTVTMQTAVVTHE